MHEETILKLEGNLSLLLDKYTKCLQNNYDASREVLQDIEIVCNILQKENSCC